MPPTGKAEVAGEKRGAYRRNYREKLDGIETRRKDARISRAELAVRAGMDPATLSLNMTSGKAFPATIASLIHALRELTKEKARAAAQFNQGEL